LCLSGRGIRTGIGGGVVGGGIGDMDSDGDGGGGNSDDVVDRCFRVLEHCGRVPFVGLRN